jgi:RHS repeat-associated protein
MKHFSVKTTHIIITVAFCSILSCCRQDQDISGLTSSLNAEIPNYQFNQNPEMKNNLPAHPKLSVVSKSRENVQKVTNSSTTVYTAEKKHGQIGTHLNNLPDDPSDNVFQIWLEDTNNICKAFLSYELYGLKDYSCISLSINDGLSLGAAQSQVNKNWNIQREQIPIHLLKVGNNVVRFTAPEGEEHAYSVRNIGLIIQRGNKKDRQKIVVRKLDKYFIGNKAYLSGYIAGCSPDLDLEINANGKKLDFYKGQFFGVIERPMEVLNPNWNIKLTAFAQGKIISERNIEYTQVNHTTFVPEIIKPIVAAKAEIEPNSSILLTAGGSRLMVDSGAVKDKNTLSITTLRDIDAMPTQSGLVNVTGNYKAYRMLPHGMHFKKAVSIGLPYDSTQIPAGHTAKDIRTYYFDEQKATWVELPFDSLDTKNKMVYALSNHFTDFINGIIEVPESPQTQGYTPNSIKDLEVANPAAGIIQMEAPTANNRGSANLNYPLKLPAGRKGMQPQLSVSYSSEGGNGWLGKSWNLSIPSISIETRWGVPRYNDTLETETYLYGGGQLSPVAHRGSWVKRSAEKQFSPRIEGEFSKIIRHGDNPTNYWWEVTSKSGVKSWFGSSDGKNLSPEFCLRDRNGNVAEWKLAKVIDLNGNSIEYQYWRPAYDQAPLKGGAFLYPSHIYYTGHKGTRGKYSINFILQDNTKIDGTIYCNNGFKMADAYLLDRVEVKFTDKIIRSYSFNYKSGVFHKTLLTKITENDAEGNEFYSHDFEYFNDVYEDTVFTPFKEFNIWNARSDNLNRSGILEFAPFSAISSTESNTVGAGIYVGFGKGKDITSKGKTVGGNYSFNTTEIKGINTLIDLNGDRLPDKVFVKGKKLYYRPQIKGKRLFGDSILIDDNLQFQYTVNKENNTGMSSILNSYSADFLNQKSQSTTKNYFADVNCDGLIDIVKNGRVYYNAINSKGHPSFVKDVNKILFPTSVGSDLDSLLVKPDSIEWSDEINDNPLHDIVKVWTAPYDGVISIEGDVKMVETIQNEKHKYTDGVLAKIQINKKIKWSGSISRPFSSILTPKGVDNLKIKVGDRIFFRIQSRFNAMHDKVSWNPKITYINEIPKPDVNGLDSYQYNAAEDFLLSSSAGISLPVKGKIHIEPYFIKPITSDNIFISISLVDSNNHGEFIYSDTVSWNTTYDGKLLINSIDVPKTNQYLKVKVSSATNVNWSDITLQTKVRYLTSEDERLPYRYIKDKVFHCVSYFETFNQTRKIQDPYIVPKNEVLQILPLVDKTKRPVKCEYFNSGYICDTTQINGSFYLSAKRIGKAPYKKKIKVYNNHLSTDSLLKNIAVDKNDALYFEIHTYDSLIYLAMKDSIKIQYIDTTIRCGLLSGGSSMIYALDTIKPYTLWGDTLIYSEKIGGIAKITGMHFDTTRFYAPVRINMYTPKDLFGPGYRNWGQFAYQSDSNRININEIVPLSSYDPVESPIKVLYANGIFNRWVGFDDSVYVARNTMNSSRLGKKDLIEYNKLVQQKLAERAGKRAINKRSKTTTNIINAKRGMISGFSFNKTLGKTKIKSEFTDMNGDGYPDIINGQKIQYSLPTGGLSSQTSIFYSGISVTDLDVTGLSVNGSHPKSLQTSVGRYSQYIPNGAGLKSSNNSSKYTLQDINGDGLPDSLGKEGQVRLNLGYKFGEVEHWSISKIRATESFNLHPEFKPGNFNIDFDKVNGELKGASYQFSIDAGSYVAGVGVTSNYTYTNWHLADVNGDGLIDKVRTSDSGKRTYVKINTGSGFLAEERWYDINALTTQYNIVASINGAFTIGIPIPTPTAFYKLTFTPSGQVSEDITRTTESHMDINGDGFPDYIMEEGTNKIKVNLSTIGRSNMLHKVHRPLGSTIKLEYKQRGNTFNLPQNKWVLAQVSLNDNHSGDGADTIKTAYSYGQGYYDRYERAFYGFDSVITRQLDTENKDSVYREIVQVYENQSYYTQGLLKKEELFDKNGHKFTESNNNYKFRDVTTDMEKTSADLPQFAQGESYFPFLTKSIQYFYEMEGTPQKSYRKEFDYDEKGNVTTYKDFGDVDAGDAVIIGEVNYHENADNYLYGIPSSIHVFSGGKLYRQRETSIDKFGNLAEIRSYITANDFAKVNIDYDNLGNMTRITFPENSNGQRMYYQYTYDPEVRSFITEVKDAFGYTSSSEYDYRFGTLTKSYDINQHPMNFTYDSKARLLTVTGPREIENTVEFTIRHSYFPHESNPRALTEHYDQANPNDPIETVCFTDALGRTIQTKKDAAVFIDDKSPDKDVMLVSGKIIYDAFGRTVATYFPVYEDKGNSAVFNTDVDDIAPTLVHYDVLDRQLKTTLPDGNESTMSYGFENDREGIMQFVTHSTDPLGNTTSQYTDVRERVHAIKMPGDIWLSNKIDPIGQVLQVIDNEHNITSSTYDLLGRRLERNHPDAGLSLFAYDKLGNIISSQPAHIDKPIRYEYEYNRLTDIIYPTNTYNNVHYEYGAPGAGDNRAGRVKLIEDATGGQLMFYGNMGEVVKNLRTVVVPDNGSYGFSTEFEYDSWGRLLKIAYPDGEHVSYEYNSGGKIKGMKGHKGLSNYNYVKRLSYDKFEQRRYIAYGNNTQSHYQYNPERRWLSKLNTTTASGRVIQANSYSYDAVGNILQLANNADMVNDKSLHGGPITHNYIYDNRYQLTSAWGSYTSANMEHRYTLNMSYGGTGSILTKHQVNESRLLEGDNPQWIANPVTSYKYAFNYNGKLPHAVTSIDNLSSDEKYVYEYDRSGNTLTNDEPGSTSARRLIWTEENRIAAIKSKGNVSHYIYDASGERILKLHSNSLSISINGVSAGISKVNNKFSIYPSSFFVMRADQYTKHFYIEGQRILSKIGSDVVKEAFLQENESGDNEEDYMNFPAKQNELGEQMKKNLSGLGIKWYRNSKGEVPPRYVKHYFLAQELGNKVGGSTSGGNDHTNDSLLANDPKFELKQYYFHPDHLGSSNYLSDIRGEVYQHAEYLPFGELFVEERNTGQDGNPYLYNGKEKDEMTGLYYYGARYYDARVSNWLSVDPLAEKNFESSPFAYCHNNPIKLIDPDGRDDEPATIDLKYFLDQLGINNHGVKSGEATVKAKTFKGKDFKPSPENDAAATNSGGSWWSDANNSAIGRMADPDFLAVGVGFNGIAGVGGGTSIEFRWVTHGPEASWKPMITVTESVGGGFSVDATLNIEAANYIGNVNNITRSMMQTSSPNGDFPTIWGSCGVAAGGKIGVTGYVTPNVGGSFIIGRELNLGAGLSAGLLPANGAGGASNTWILYDFYK